MMMIIIIIMVMDHRDGDDDDGDDESDDGDSDDDNNEDDKKGQHLYTLKIIISTQLCSLPSVSTPSLSRFFIQAATTGSAPLLHGTGENLLAITGFASLKPRFKRPGIHRSEMIYEPK